MRPNVKLMKPADEMEAVLAQFDAEIKRTDRMAYVALGLFFLGFVVLACRPEWLGL